MSGGFTPIISLACHRGGKPEWSDAASAFLAPSNLSGLVPTGASAGISGLSACLEDGSLKGNLAASALGFASGPATFDAISGEMSPRPSNALWLIPNIKGKAFVDYQNDVHSKDINAAAQEGYGHVELAKRYTTNGMATDQGKLSNVNATALLANARGLSPAQVGTTTFRPFYTPVSFGALAGASHGKHFQPVRKSPSTNGRRRTMPLSLRPGCGTAHPGSRGRAKPPGARAWIGRSRMSGQTPESAMSRCLAR